MLTDIEISRSTRLAPIAEIAGTLGVQADDVIPYGKYKAKIPLSYIDDEKAKNSNLILVSALTPTKAGVGKTVTSVALSLGLNIIGKNADSKRARNSSRRRIIKRELHDPHESLTIRSHR